MSNPRYDVPGTCIKMSGTRGNIGKDDSSRNITANQIQCHGFKICPQAAAGAFFNSSPDDLRLFVNQALGDDANDGTSTNPLLTLQGAYDKIHEVGYNNSAIIEIMDSGGPLQVNANTPVNTATGSRGKQVAPPMIRGSARTTVLPSQAVTAVAVAAANLGTELTVSGVGFGAAGSMRGNLIRFTSGVLSGQSLWIGDNINATDLVFAINTSGGNPAFTPAIGDTFVIESLTSSVALADDVTLSFIGGNRHKYIEMHDLTFTHAGAAATSLILTESASLMLDAIEMTSPAGALFVMQPLTGEHTCGFPIRTNNIAPSEGDPTGNAAFRSGAGVRFSSSRLNLAHCHGFVMDNLVLHATSNIRASTSSGALLGVYADDSNIEATEGTTLELNLLISRNCTAARAVEGRDMAHLSLNSFHVEAANDTGIGGEEGSRLYLEDGTVETCVNNGVLANQGGGFIYMDNTVVDACGNNVVISEASVSLRDVTCTNATGGNGFTLTGCKVSQMDGSLTITGNAGNGMFCRGSDITIQDGVTPTIDLNGGDGVQVESTKWYSDNIVGPANGGVGMVIIRSSSVMLTAGAAATTLSGAGGNVIVGSLVVATWATIATNATATACDYAAATTFNCSCVSR